LCTAPEPVAPPVSREKEPQFKEASIVPEEAPPAPKSEMEQLVADLCKSGPVARKVTILGTAPGEGITLTALTLARMMAQDVKVVLVDLAGTSPVIANMSADSNAPGLAELMQGEASFSQIITKDKLSRAHLVAAGRPGFDRALLTSPRLVLAIDALLRVYDRVLLDAGAASDLPAELLTASARAVVVPDAGMQTEARTQMCGDLKAAGFSAVTMLSKACDPSEVFVPAPRVVAA
jgi:Mrp family chromosome partitioning ATPase